MTKYEGEKQREGDLKGLNTLLLCHRSLNHLAAPTAQGGVPLLPL